MLDQHYKQKYEKYKTKYLNIMKGGAFAFDKTNQHPRGKGPTINFTILAKIDGNTLDRINLRRTQLGLPLKNDLHITLLSFQVNDGHPNSNIFKSKEFADHIASAFNIHVKGSGVQLSSVVTDPITQTKKGAHQVLGRKGSEYFARIYELEPQYHTAISNFRREVYNFINIKLGQPTHFTERRGSGVDIDEFEIYSYGGQELYAINRKQYYGLSSYLPHISILSVTDLGPSLQQNIRQPNGDLLPDQNVVVEIKRNWHFGQEGAISNIDTKRDVNEIRVAYGRTTQRDLAV